jgi:hypothetical protein
MQPHSNNATHHLVHLGIEEEFWSHTKVKNELEAFHNESGHLQNHPPLALLLARVDPSHKPPHRYKVLGNLLGGVSHQHQATSSIVNKYPSQQVEEHEHVVTHTFSWMDLILTEMFLVPTEFASILVAIITSSQLGVD